MWYALSLTVDVLIFFKQHKQVSQSSAIIWLHMQYCVCSSKHFLNGATKLYIGILNNKGNTIMIGNFFDYCRYSFWFLALKWSCIEKKIVREVSSQSSTRSLLIGTSNHINYWWTLVNFPVSFQYTNIWFSSCLVSIYQWQSCVSFKLDVLRAP